MFLKRAFVWAPSVTMPTWAPVKETYRSPSAWIASVIGREGREDFP